MRIKTHHSTKKLVPPLHQTGATLLELLVGITIGLLTVAVGIGALMISRGVSGTVSDASNMQQQAAYAFRVIGSQVRQAGTIQLSLDATAFTPSETSYAMLPVAFDPPDPAGQRPMFSRGEKMLKGIDNPSSSEYALSIGYQNYQEQITPPPPATDLVSGNQLRDCLGENKGVSSNYVIESKFRISSDNELLCEGVGGTAKPIIRNVKDMKIRYLIQEPTSAKTGFPKTIYTNASTASSSPNGWRDVYAIEVCLELEGTETIDTAGANYTKCDGISVSRGNRLRMVFKNTFQIRSQGQVQS